MSDPGGRDDATVRDRIEAWLHERTDGHDGAGTARWPEAERDVYALAIEEAAHAIAADLESFAAALDLPARDAQVRAEALAPFEALADEWEASTSEGQGVVREHWRGPDYVDGQDHALERCTEQVRAALASAGPVEPSPAAEEADDPGPRWDYYRGVQRVAGEPLTGGEGRG